MTPIALAQLLWISNLSIIKKDEPLPFEMWAGDDCDTCC